jgi:DNA invertase Pin-like site-specific DNA recombinase
MSRAVLKLLLARTIQRDPTDAELTDFLRNLRDLAGERVYVPQRDEPDANQAARILAMRQSGMSVRKIAREEKISKSQVHRALSQNPDLFVDTQAA